MSQRSPSCASRQATSPTLILRSPPPPALPSLPTRRSNARGARGGARWTVGRHERRRRRGVFLTSIGIEHTEYLGEDVAVRWDQLLRFAALQLRVDPRSGLSPADSDRMVSPGRGARRRDHLSPTRSAGISDRWSPRRGRGCADRSSGHAAGHLNNPPRHLSCPPRSVANSYDPCVRWYTPTRSGMRSA